MTRSDQRSARDLVEELSRRQRAADDTVLDDLVATDMVNHAAGPQGRDGLKTILRTIEVNLGPTELEQHHRIGEGDLVVQHVTLHGTHRASTMPLLADAPVTGQSAAWAFIHIWRVADGDARRALGLSRRHGAARAAPAFVTGDRLTVGVVTPHAAAGPEVELPAMTRGRVVTVVSRTGWPPEASQAPSRTAPPAHAELRLNRGGDRQLNRALHDITLTRWRADPRTHACITRRPAAGKSDTEIRRTLKRYIARELFRALEAAPAA